MMLIVNFNVVSDIERLSIKAIQEIKTSKMPNEDPPALHVILQTTAMISNHWSAHKLLLNYWSDSLEPPKHSACAVPGAERCQNCAQSPQACRTNRLQKWDLSQQMPSLGTCPCVIENHNFCCVFVPCHKGEKLPILRLVTSHWTKHSRLQTPHGWIQRLSSVPI